MYLEELAVVEHVRDHFVHVIGLVRGVGDERVEFRVDLVQAGAVQTGAVRAGVVRAGVVRAVVV